MERLISCLLWYVETFRLVITGAFELQKSLSKIRTRPA